MRQLETWKKLSNEERKQLIKLLEQYPKEEIVKVLRKNLDGGGNTKG
jgi:hypothetical protein